MKASDWLGPLPPSHGPAREAAILAAVRTRIERYR